VETSAAPSYIRTDTSAWDTRYAVAVAQTGGLSHMHFLRLLAAWWTGAQSARDNYLLICNFTKYSPINIFSLTDLATNLSEFDY